MLRFCALKSGSSVPSMSGCSCFQPFETEHESRFARPSRFAQQRTWHNIHVDSCRMSNVTLFIQITLFEVKQHLKFAYFHTLLSFWVQNYTFSKRPQICKICQNMYVFPSRWKFRTDFHVFTKCYQLPNVVTEVTLR